MSPVYGFSPNALRYLEHCLACLDSFEGTYGTKFELIAMVNGVVTTYVGNELATAERVRALPWSEEQENAVRGAYLGGQVATGAYPRMAAAFMEDAGPIDLEAVFRAGVGAGAGRVRPVSLSGPWTGVAEGRVGAAGRWGLVAQFPAPLKRLRSSPRPQRSACPRPRAVPAPSQIRATWPSGPSSWWSSTDAGLRDVSGGGRMPALRSSSGVIGDSIVNSAC